MFLRTKLTRTGLMLALLITTGAVVQAQQSSTQNPSNNTGRIERGGGRGFRRAPGRGRNFAPRMLRQLNLTEAQKEQVHAIVKQTFESNKATREELRLLGQKRRQGTLSADDQARARTLHQQMRAAMTETRTRIAGILTPEQRAKMEELRKNREADGGNFGRRRRGFRDGPGPGNPPATKPANP